MEHNQEEEMQKEQERPLSEYVPPIFATKQIVFTAIVDGTSTWGLVIKFVKHERVPTYIYGKLHGKEHAEWLECAKFQIGFVVPDDMYAFLEGPRVLMPPRCDLKVFEHDVPCGRTGTELFAGSCNLSRSLEREGFAMLKHDRKLPRGRPDVVTTDFDQLRASQVLRLFGVTYLHASPDCATFSQLAGSKHGRRLDNAFMGTSPQAHRMNGTLLKLYTALRVRLQAGPFFFTLENPECTFHHHALMRSLLETEGVGLVTLSFCAFGEPVRKNTVFVTNLPTLRALAGDDAFYCGPACQQGCRFRPGGHQRITTGRRTTGKRKRDGVVTEEVTAFPPMLTDVLARCVDADVRAACGTFVACNTTGCRFHAGHRGLCSTALVTARTTRMAK
jgi:hypothetical protein